MLWLNPLSTTLANCWMMPTHHTSLQLLHRLEVAIRSITGSLSAGVAEHIRMAGVAVAFRVAGVAKQQTTMARIARTLGHAGHCESHATSTTYYGSDPSIRGHPKLASFPKDKTCQIQAVGDNFYWSTWVLAAAKLTCPACRDHRKPQFR